MLGDDNFLPLIFFSVVNQCNNVECLNDGVCQPVFIGELCPLPTCQCTGCWTGDDCSICKLSTNSIDHMKCCMVLYIIYMFVYDRVHMFVTLPT